MAIHNKDIFESKKELLQGNVQIIACAGSGKTEFVSERIAYQIFKGIARPSEIVAITFNDAAAEELKFRVRDKIKELIGKQPDIGDMYIGTIHAFAFKILQDFVPEYRGYDMLDENSRKAFTASLKWSQDINIPVLYKSLKKRGYNYNPFFSNGNPQYWENWTMSTFLQDVDFYREESLSANHILSDTFKKSLPIFLKRMEERKFLDFSGILRLTVDSLEKDNYIIKQIQKQYKFFTIDEYQDVNPIQEKFIRLISQQKNVCVVGDDDQSIYQWRGADIENIIQFSKNYQKVTTHKLEMNRRSHNKIVFSAADFIKSNAKRLKKKIQPNNTETEEGDLYKICFPTQSEELSWIVQKIKDLYGKEYVDKGNPRKLKYSDMVLLFRKRKTAKEYKEALENSNIKVIYSGMGELMESEEIRPILKTFQYIGQSVHVKHPDINDSMEDIHEDIQQNFHISRNKFIELINELIEFCKSQKRISLQGIYYKLLSGLGLEKIEFHNQEDDVILYNLGRFSQAISDFEGSRTYLTKNSILDFVDFIKTFVSNAYDEGTTDANEGLIDAVKIMTMHGTKGLGFPVVFMPSLKGELVTSSQKQTFLDASKIDFSRYGGNEADERRLFYVAMTRAKKFLFITTFEKKKKNKTAIHPFFYQVPDKYFLTDAQNDPTKRKPCNIERFDSDQRFPTNYSELSYYLNCSYDYKLRFMFGFNPELVQALGYGKQVHNIINLLHKEYEKTKKIPTKVQIREFVEKYFYLRYAADKQKETLKKSCVESLEKYINLWKKDFSLAIKTEQNFELDFENIALLNGSIDMLSRSENKDDIVEVIDFKTGKSTSQFSEKYHHQVILYAIAAEEALSKNIKSAYLHYLDAKEIDVDKIRIKIDITKAKKDETKHILKKAVNGITNNQFKRNPSKVLCNGCDWKPICPKK